MNNFDADTLLRAFPFELSKTTRMAMIASIVAEELQSLSDDHDLLVIFARIDELDDAIFRQLCRGFSDEEAAQLTALIDRMLENAFSDCQKNKQGGESADA